MCVGLNKYPPPPLPVGSVGAGTFKTPKTHTTPTSQPTPYHSNPRHIYISTTSHPQTSLHTYITHYSIPSTPHHSRTTPHLLLSNPHHLYTTATPYPHISLYLHYTPPIPSNPSPYLYLHYTI